MALATDPRDTLIAAQAAALALAREALGPFSAFCPKAEAFVESRVNAANDTSGIMPPTKDFRLADFRRAREAHAAIGKVKGTGAGG
jgi:hypothetical protein